MYETALTALSKALDADYKGKDYTKHLDAAAAILTAVVGAPAVEKAKKKVDSGLFLSEQIVDAVYSLGKAAGATAKGKDASKHIAMAAAVLA